MTPVPGLSPEEGGDGVHVAIVTNAYAPRIGGITAYLGDLAQGLMAERIPTRVFSMPEVFNRVDEPQLGRRGWRRTVHLVFVGFFVLKTLLLLLSVRLRSEHTIVHSHSASYCLLICLFAKAMGCVGLHTFHSPLTGDSLILRRLVPKADACVFVSSSLRDLYAERGITSPRPRIIPGAVNLTVFRPPTAAERQVSRESLSDLLPGVAEGRPVILFVGRIVFDKGVDVLLASCDELFAREDKPTVVIVGPPETSPEGESFFRECTSRIRSSGWHGRIALMGPVMPQRLRQLYWASDIFVCPSRWQEPSPIVVIEALACGLPVVASRVGGLPERIDDGVNGILVTPGDPRDLARGILSILNNRERARVYSSAARGSVVSSYGSELMIDRHLALYRELIADRRHAVGKPPAHLMD